MPEWWLQLYEFVYSNADVAAAAAAVAPPPPPMMQIIIIFFLVLFQAGFKTTCRRQWTMGNFSGATGW